MNPILTQSIRQILMAGSTAVLAAGVISVAAAAITPGVQIPPPGPFQVPDYFGVSSNYATSPTPNFALVTITPATGTTPTRPAVAAATTTDYLNPNYGLSPVGMYTKNLMDVQIVDVGAGYTAAPTVTVTGQTAAGSTTVNLTPIVVNGAIVGFKEIPHGDIGDPSNPAWPQDPNTLQWIYPAGATFFGTTTLANGQVWAGLGVQLDPVTGNVSSAPNNFTQPVPGTGIRKFVNSVSLPGSTNDLGQTLSIADPTVYGSPFPADANGVVPDYYEIAEVAYTQQLHSDLPPTHLRGYIQLVPATMLGAVDITTLTNIQTTAPANTYYVKPGTTNASYLGPVIVAQKNKPVRIKAVNLLPTGAAGDLPFPVDHTFMGAGDQDATGLTVGDQPDTRTAIHLHGGTTPWISDGTPRQWFLPNGDTAKDANGNLVTRGVSATDVPDMWFTKDANGNSTGILAPASCQGTISAACAASYTNNPGAGALTFYYTNEQSARLMFYHDHAEGITRLNVYAGMAAAYILQDPTEQAMTHGSKAAGTNKVTYANGSSATYNEVLPEDVIPLVVQEKTFVPDNTKPVLTFYGPFRSQLNAQDPTWRWGTKGQSWDGVTDSLVSFGQLDPIAGVTYGANGPGDLWVPHVYMTNQNPGDASGANPQGRWDYGSWFWPPATGILHPQVTNPYYDSSCTSANINNPVGTCEFQYIPGFPNGGTMPSNTQSVNCSYTQNGTGTSVKSCTPLGFVSQPELDAMSQASSTPEAFNDTPLVNGTVYPYMNVEPKKYRLRLLNAGNDRTWNLSMWVASSKNVDTTSDANAGATVGDAGKATCNGANINFTTTAASSVAAANTAVSVAPADCTEVRMVPWNASQNISSKFPTTWYTALKGGITFDGRPGGVPDPAVRGPAMVQIGTEGGFLAEPAVIKNQPVNYEYNVKNILVTNVKEHALLLGAAERADVVVDFSQFAGSTIILYNDAPAATPAFDLRLDYFTGDFDNTDTGGSFSTVPGYGPNTRTLMQFRVASACTSANCGTGINRTPAAAASNHQDDVDSTWLASATAEVRKAFKNSQEPIVVPQAAYNNVYGTNVADAVSSNLSAISDTSLNFQPFQLDNNGNLVLDTQTGNVILDAAVTLGMEPKAIQELFTLDYGRMNATLGTEIPNTSATTQTTIPLGYAEPPTELVQMTNNNPNAAVSIGQLGDGTQIWKITHNGVDTHPVHFHLFSVQLLNRVGWDGAVYNPEPNEIGWKEVLRMNPLSDVIVALRPKTLTLPFKLGNSHHIADSTQGVGSTVNQPNLDPTTGNGSTVTNQINNYGWEYVWHCHILGHEENDFMRSIAVAQVPEAPSNLAVDSVSSPGNNVLTWTDNSVNSNWVTIQRSQDSTFKDATIIANFSVNNPVAPPYNQYGECTSQDGCARTWTDTAVPGGVSYYRVVAHSTVGTGDIYGRLPAELKQAQNNIPPYILPAGGQGFQGYDNATADSAASTVVAGANKDIPTAAVIAPTGNTIVPPGNPASYDFGNQVTVANAYANTVPSQTFTVKNVGTGTLNIGSASLQNGGAFTITSNGCNGAALTAGQSCNIAVRFRPIATGAQTNTLSIKDNSNGSAATQRVTLTGTGIAGAYGVLTPNPMASLTTPVGTSSSTTLTLTNRGSTGSTLQFNTANIKLVNDATNPVASSGFAVTGGTCLTPVGPRSIAANSSCTVIVAFTPTAAGSYTGNLSIVDNSNTVAPAVATQTVTLSGLGGTSPAPTVGTVTNSSVALSWPTVNGATSYTVQRATNSAFTGTVASYNTSNLSFTVTGLSANTNYYFRVVANNGTSSTISDVTAAVLTVPGTAGTTSATTTGIVGSRSTALSWPIYTAGNGTITGYDVQVRSRVVNANNWGSWGAAPAEVIIGPQTVGTTRVTANVTYNTVTTLQYQFRVAPINSSGTGGYGGGSATQTAP